MRISKRPKFYKKIEKRYRVNQQIRVPEVRLIDENGQNLGVVKTFQAQEMARQKGLDLIEVSPLSQPPVAKIFDYNKLKYREEKEKRKERAKQKKIEVKGIRLSLRISKHDLEIRQNQAKTFLEDGNKVKIEMLLRGRERGHKNLAREIINKFMADLNQQIQTVVEQPLSILGEKLSITLAKKQN